MPKNTSQKGSAREHKVFDRLSKQNYFCIRSAGSHGQIDVVGIYIGKDPSQPLIRLVQSKSNRKITKDELNALRTLVKVFNDVDYLEGIQIQFEVWYWIDFAREPIITVIDIEEQYDKVLY